MDTNTAKSGIPDIPLDIWGLIAEALAFGASVKEKRSLYGDIKRCCLVNRLFAQAFQPFIYHWTTLSCVRPLRIRKRLAILDSSPHLGAYVKNLAVVVRDRTAQGTGAAGAELCSILDGGLLSGVRTLKIIAYHWQEALMEWNKLPQLLASSIARFCVCSQALRTLGFWGIGGAPASLFANPSLKITRLHLRKSCPAFDFPDVCEDYISTGLSLDVSTAILGGVDLVKIATHGKGFFSRVCSLQGKISWKPEKNNAFDRFLSIVGSIAYIQELDLSVEYLSRTPFDGPFKQHWVKCLPEFKGLKRLALSSTTPSLTPHFISWLPVVIEALDTSRLESLSIGISDINASNLTLHCLPDVNGPASETPAAAGWSALDGLLVARQEQGKLGMLEDVQITIRIGNRETPTEFTYRGLMAVMRQAAAFLPHFPSDLVWVRLQRFKGASIYDSRALPLR